MVALGYAIGYITVLYSELKWAHYNGVLPATVSPILTCNCLLLVSARGTSAAFPTSRRYIYILTGGASRQNVTYIREITVDVDAKLFANDGVPSGFEMQMKPLFGRRCRRAFLTHEFEMFRNSTYSSMPTRFSNDVHEQNNLP